MNKLRMATLLLVSALLTAGAAEAGNIIPPHWSIINSDGLHGVLRAGSPWGPGSTPSALGAPVDGVFAPETQQWNNGSYWWDEDPSVNPSTPVHYTIQLDGVFTLDHFIMQADDNDTYRVEWWDGAAWQIAWDVPAIPSFGLVTRDSGVFAPISTDRLRLTATSGDNYYAISEFEAFAVPEPGSLSLALLALGLAGLGSARRKQ